MAESTKEIENKIEKAKSWDEMKAILKDLPRTTFTVRLSELLDKYNHKISQAQIKTSISKSQFYAISNGTRNPSKHDIIEIAFAIGASLEELNELLKLAGHKELYSKNKDDAIIIFGLKNKKSIYEIDELLEESGYKLRFNED